jgi:glycine cleavage system H protein
VADTPTDLKYAESHEWVRMDGDVATIGITDYAQDALTDVVFVELPSRGDEVTTGETFGVVESVKSVSELYAPVSGTVLEVNDALVDEPETINDDPYGEGWMLKVKVSDASAVEKLMDAAAYEKSVGEA